MNQLAVINTETGELTQFDPTQARNIDALHDARIELAARLGNVDALEREIDRKLDDQEDAVIWWRANVRRPGSKRSNISDTEIFTEQAEKILGFNAVTISRWAKKLGKRDEYREQISRAARRKLQLEPEENHRAQGTGENEWYTPSKYIEAARQVLGAIDLDPASSPKANLTIKADRIFTLGDDGLQQEWGGRVWLNPPYAQPLIGQFIEKLLTEIGEGRVSEALLLTHNYTDTSWFHSAESGAALLCFTRGRIAFESPSGEVAAPTQGQCFFYYGDKPEEFRRKFVEFGFVR